VLRPTCPTPQAFDDTGYGILIAEDIPESFQAEAHIAQATRAANGVVVRVADVG
jgi:hypothetical protein